MDMCDGYLWYKCLLFILNMHITAYLIFFELWEDKRLNEWFSQANYTYSKSVIERCIITLREIYHEIYRIRFAVKIKIRLNTEYICDYYSIKCIYWESYF